MSHRPRSGDPDAIEAREAYVGPLYRVPYGDGDGWMLAERTLLHRDGKILFLSAGGHTVIDLAPQDPVAEHRPHQPQESK